MIKKKTLEFPEIDDGDFKKAVNQAISEKRHVDYIEEVLGDYEEYKKVFADAFTKANLLDKVFTFRAEYLSDKNIWRDIRILGIQTFNDLANSIIESINWENDHMHGFSLKKKVEKRFGMQIDLSMFAPGWDDDPYPTYKTDEVLITNIDYEKNPVLEFIFDFGDCHEFDVELIKTEDLQKGDSIKTLPKCIDKHGKAPEQYPAIEE